jgi:uncharacterized protein
MSGGNRSPGSDAELIQQAVHTTLYVRYAVRMDAEKDQANQKKHGIAFETAQEVFDDPNQVVFENYLFDDAEQRYQIIGMTRNLILLLALFVERSEHRGEIVHLISARKANKYEQGVYQDQFR